MELTGKCKEEFEKWHKEVQKYNIGWFYKLQSEHKYGVFENYFDSVGIRISINQHDGTYWYDIQSPFFECDEMKTRPEARTAAIEKANELRNEVLNKQNMKNIKLLEVIENTKQLPQVQYGLERQLIELRVMANKLGLYDAADFLNKQNMAHPTRIFNEPEELKDE